MLWVGAVSPEFKHRYHHLLTVMPLNVCFGRVSISAAGAVQHQHQDRAGQRGPAGWWQCWQRGAPRGTISVSWQPVPWAPGQHQQSAGKPVGADEPQPSSGQGLPTALPGLQEPELLLPVPQRLEHKHHQPCSSLPAPRISSGGRLTGRKVAGTLTPPRR